MGKLERPVRFNQRIQPACLPNKDHCFAAGTACVASGWGYIKEGGPRSSLLREVAVRIMDTDHCNRPDYYNGRVLPGMLCAGYNAGERDACTGDSGGPLVCPLPNGKWVLTGVTSWGVGCARHKRPGVYSDARKFSDWIGSLINEYPDVVGSCSTRGINGYGFNGNWNWVGKMPSRPPSQFLYDSSEKVASVASAAAKPDLSSAMELWHGLPSGNDKEEQEKRPSKEVTRPTRRPTTKATTKATTAATQAPASDEKGSDPCKGLTKKALKKCRKKAWKKNTSGGNKKAKKDKKKEFKALFEGLSKAEKKALKAQQAAEEETGMRDASYDVDTAAVEDDNVLFAGWDMQ